MSLRNGRLPTSGSTARAVSPVVGVVLLVAIAVLLSAVLGGMVLAIGDQPEPAPETAWSFVYDGNKGDPSKSAGHIKVTYEQGPPIPLDQLVFEVTRADDDDPERVRFENSSYWSTNKIPSQYFGKREWVRQVSGDVMKPGDHVIVGYEIGTWSIDPHNEVRIVWETENEEQTYSIARYDVDRRNPGAE